MVNATVADSLRIAPQFRSEESDTVAEQLGGRLDRRLKRYEPDQIDLEISVKDRDTPQQRVTLEAWVAAKGRTRFVGTSDNPELMAAVRDVGEQVERQLDRYITKWESSRRS